MAKSTMIHLSKGAGLRSKMGNEKGIFPSFLDLARTRLLIVGALFSLGFLIVGVRLVNITCLQHGPESLYADAAAHTGLQSGRADLVDRHGVVLATSITTSSLYANPRVVLNVEEAALKLSKVLPFLKKQDLLEKLKSEKGFVWLARHLSPQQISNIICLGIPGIDFMSDQRRIYPHGNLIAHVVGFADIDGNGISGLEKGLDARLRSESNPIQLSLDLSLQHVLHDELSTAIEEFSAEGGSGMIMDIKNGEILAMVSRPDFDPNRPNPNDQKAMFNQITLGVYEMGSTLKIFNTAMALESGLITVDSRYDVTHPLTVGRFKVTDFHPHHVPLNVQEIFIHSSNIGSALMALKSGIERQKEFMSRIGFLGPLKIELPETGLPLSPKHWREANLITISYGYGLSMTPLQVGAAVAGVANHGMMRSPTLLKASTAYGPGKRIISPDTSAKILEMMRLVVHEGTGRKASVPGITVMGKTGTSNNRKAHGRGYQKKDVRTSFVGVFPNKPRYMVFIMLDSPKATKATYGFNTAGWNSAAVAGRVIKRMSTIVGILPQFEPEEGQPLVRQVTLRH
jgi:cell division protein FtsI (penicillin-binding protein 3)